jgi:translation initiation factor 2 beta subunit (eIF-2beta)/eIF-5
MRETAKAFRVCAIALLLSVGITRESVASELEEFTDKFLACVKEKETEAEIDKRPNNEQTLEESLRIRKDCCAKHKGTWSDYSKFCSPPN